MWPHACRLAQLPGNRQWTPRKFKICFHTISFPHIDNIPDTILPPLPMIRSRYATQKVVKSRGSAVHGI